MSYKKRLFDRFLENLIKAGKNMVNEKYFKLDVTGLKDPKQFERNYCYELYHQLRSVDKDNFPLTIGPEIDKGDHPIISVNIGDVIPDLIIHKPKFMNLNLVVIEVKPYKNGKVIGMKRDVEKLRDFLNNANYFRGIMLVFSNENLREPPENIKQKMKLLKGRIRTRLLFIWHGGPGLEPIIVDF